MASEQLICAACGFNNEPERVYCHSCGAKLHRSFLPATHDDKGHESAKTAQRRIKKLTNPGSYTIGRLLKSLIAVAVWAALAAAIFLISQMPVGVPEDKAQMQRLIQSDLMDATQSASPRTISFTEAEVNGTLKQTLKRASGGGSIPGIEFERGYVRLHPNVVHVGAQQSLWGYPIHSGVDYQLKVVDGKFTPVLLGGNFGRLTVPAVAMQYLDFAFQKLWDALKRERGQMDRMQNVTISEGQIVFVTKPAGVK